MALKEKYDLRIPVIKKFTQTNSLFYNPFSLFFTDTKMNFKKHYIKTLSFTLINKYKFKKSELFNKHSILPIE